MQRFGDCRHLIKTKKGVDKRPPIKIKKHIKLIL